MPNGLTLHQASPRPRACSRTSAMVRYDAAPRSIGAVPPPAAAAQLAPRNSSLVATRSCARLRARSGSSTSTWVSSGIRSTSSSISSTSTGASDSMPSTAMPAAILSVSSSSWGWAAPSSAARRRTSSVSSSSRHGGAQSRSTFSSVRWSATEKRADLLDVVAPELHPQRVLLGRREDVDDAAADRELAAPLDQVDPGVRRGREPAYDVLERRRVARRQLDRLEVAQPLDLGLEHRADRRDDDLQRPVGGVGRPGGGAGGARRAGARPCRCAG